LATLPTQFKANWLNLSLWQRFKSNCLSLSLLVTFQTKFGQICQFGNLANTVQSKLAELLKTDIIDREMKAVQVSQFDSS